MYQCNSCGWNFQHLRHHWEHSGEYYGFPTYERVGGCPRCGGGYTELSAASGISYNGRAPRRGAQQGRVQNAVRSEDGKGGKI